ncbi:MAG: S1 RNA-binding domain-containing protein [SAR202 cluster bacterium]|nr:S1 RNA-binding domain-containing protein [SAR202 cluster bacterium]
MVSSPQEQTPETLTMGELLEMSGGWKDLHRGEVVECVVMRVDQEGILVNVGGKSEGIIPSREARSLTPEAMAALEIGSSLTAYVLRTEREEGIAILSLDRARSETGWAVLEKALEADTLVEGTIVEHNRGGAVVDIEGVQAFVPLSHLLPATRQLRDQAEAGTPTPPAEPQQYKVLEVDRRGRRAILSERLAWQGWREEQKARLLEELVEGETRKGKVSGVAKFGVFVDLGGADGLIHTSELSWQSVSDPEDIVHVGDELDVMVLNIDKEKERISLSLRRLDPEPWTTITEAFEIGQIVTGTITRLTTFGAFAQIEGGIEGLVHISELSDKHITHPKEAVQEGEVLELKILNLDPERHRLGLSRRRVVEEL